MKAETTFDRKTFIVSSMFFFIVSLNLRDFPINNIPLIFPAFLLFAVLMGSKSMVEGFRRTKFLSILLITWWFYVMIFLLIKGWAIDLKLYSKLLEPLLIFSVVGATGIRPGGTKAALWALVFAITLSTALGIWIFFIGEPVLTWRTTIHTSIGGNLLQGEFIRDKDIVRPHFLQNTGFQNSIFAFSYQLAVALSVTLAGLFCKKGLTKTLFLIGVATILVVGVITNTERATLLSVPIGLLSIFLLTNKIFNKRIMFGFLICISLVWAIMNYSSKWAGVYETIYGRNFITEKISIRAYMSIPAILSVLYEPSGAGNTLSSEYYCEVAERVGWVDDYGRAIAPHNHFAGLILDIGIVGILLIIALFRKLWEKIKYVRLSAFGDDMIIIFVGCITCIIHSLTHNAGFFTGEVSTLIIFGMLWSVTAKTKYLKSNHDIINDHKSNGGLNSPHTFIE